MAAPLSPKNIDHQSSLPTAATEAGADSAEEMQTIQAEMNARSHFGQDYVTHQAETQNDQSFSPRDFSRMIILLGGVGLILIGRALSHPDIFNWLLAGGVVAAFIGATIRQQRSKARYNRDSSETGKK